MDIGIVCQKASTGGWRYALMLACALKRQSSRSRVTVHYRARRLPPGGLATLQSAGVEVARLPRLPLQRSPWPLTPKRFTGLKAIDKGCNFLRQRWKEATRGHRSHSLARSLAHHDVVHFAWPYDLDPPPLTVPMSFIPHDFIYTHEFGVANYQQRDWLATRQAHERWLASATPIVSSDFIAGELQRTFPESRRPLDVVYLSSLNPMPETGIAPAVVEEVRRRFELPARFMLCPNNVMPHKNLAGAIAALWHVRQAGDDVKLIVCGVETEGIRARVASPLYADRTDSQTDWDMRGLGLVSDADVLALMRAAALIINPSLCEAGSGSGLDAWGCGCPVALSDIPAFRDQVRFLGTRAEFFDPHDPRDIARTVCRMLADSERLARDAEESRAAIARYGWNEVATRYHAVFERMLGGSVPHGNATQGRMSG
jgi:glycosyltransferase involved in cell wall biosynthesis